MSHGGRTARALGAAIAAGLLLHGVALLRGGGGAPAPDGWPPAARADGVASWSGSTGKLFVTSIKDGAGILVWNLDASTVDYYEADLRFTAPSGVITSVVHGTAAIPKK